MTDTTTPAASKYAGLRIHFKRAITVNLGTTLASGSEVFQRGNELTLTADIIAASRDRNGDSWIIRELDKGAQSSTIGTGPWPEDVLPWRVGSADWADAREKARIEAHKHPTEAEVAEALAAVRRRFGPSAPTSRTLRTEAS
ncbi:hypothetical protein [Arenivirga flava]|uniref:Uncharacterized protein n=1 Tax=Arenivirga flava TaxID=1930060 RepID=A0AA37UNX1_9MICO|nr:hypothetical protein [Arenivirga flava]GMA27052.1 hypothetical protein GCM10025874_03050 [Arenivirga flava]